MFKYQDKYKQCAEDFSVREKSYTFKDSRYAFLSVVSLLYFREMNVGQIFLSLHFAKVPLDGLFIAINYCLFAFYIFIYFCFVFSLLFLYVLAGGLAFLWNINAKLMIL